VGLPRAIEHHGADGDVALAEAVDEGVRVGGGGDVLGDPGLEGPAGGVHPGGGDVLDRGVVLAAAEVFGRARVDDRGRVGRVVDGVGRGVGGRHVAGDERGAVAAQGREGEGQEGPDAHHGSGSTPARPQGRRASVGGRQS
jgi:hypothetical protein